MRAKPGNGAQGMGEEWGGGWGLEVGGGMCTRVDQKRGRAPARRSQAAEQSDQTPFREITGVTNVARRRQSGGREDRYLSRTVVPS